VSNEVDLLEGYELLNPNNSKTIVLQSSMIGSGSSQNGRTICKRNTMRCLKGRTRRRLDVAMEQIHHSRTLVVGTSG
jgi:hypothetical protein